MKKEFKLNGVNVELTKEQLQEMLKEFDKPVWSIKKDENEQIVLFKNKEEMRWLWLTYETYQENISKLVFIIAEEMGYLATKEQIKDEEKPAYGIRFEFNSKIGNDISIGAYNYSSHSKIIDTKEHTKEIVELIKSSEDLLKYIWMENE